MRKYEEKSTDKVTAICRECEGCVIEFDEVQNLQVATS